MLFDLWEIQLVRGQKKGSVLPTYKNNPHLKEFTGILLCSYLAITECKSITGDPWQSCSKK